MLNKNSNLRRNCQGNIGELGPVIFVLIFILLFPILNLLWFAVSYVIIALAANFYASAAVVETNYDRSLAAVYNAANKFNNSKWNLFGGLSPSGGYGNCGCDLFVKSTDINSHQVQSYGPNVSADPPIDVNGKVWEFETKVTFDARPLVNMENVPFIGSVPGLGKTCRLYFSAHKMVEHPNGLAQVTAEENFGKQPDGSMVVEAKLLGVTGTGGGGVLPDETSWFIPDIYNRIAGAGQTVVSENVFIVEADNPYWTDVPVVEIQHGYKIWIDYRAEGRWNVNLRNKYNKDIDADGDLSASIWNRDEPFPEGAMIGKIGNGEPFLLGKEKLNYPPPNTGKFKMLCFDGSPSPGSSLSEAGCAPKLYRNNIGRMHCRVIITR